ncbi:PPA1309 family protein [Corynebacterium ureicelerivorans]|uniref:PPA1309 family protein n=1 Tax=Corynebacterium ureicelerivorans TaxID=401472 RepID=UPI00264EC763|nr:PPA1309 family protein [Corynebacterium ureicelerivorans]MDN8626935.1 PPA1309 family protein [Corynebacterium ureicelerivorans]
MMEAVEFVHAEGWDAPPTLFGLVPTQLLVDELVDLDDSSPLTLVVQDLPEHILPGSEELGDYVSRIAWPAEVEGVILAQEIVFKDASAGNDAQPRPARLFSGVLRGEDLDQTLLQLRLTDEELEERGAFAQDDIELRGGPGIAPGVLAALRYGLEQDPDELV